MCSFHTMSVSFVLHVCWQPTEEWREELPSRNPFLSSRLISSHSPSACLPVYSCGELSVEDLSALKYNFQGDAAAAAAMKASALETSFGTYMRGHFTVLCVVCIVCVVHKC
jgi:hypothetical protein